MVSAENKLPDDILFPEGKHAGTFEQQPFPDSENNFLSIFNIPLGQIPRTSRGRGSGALHLVHNGNIAIQIALLCQGHVSVRVLSYKHAFQPIRML